MLVLPAKWASYFSLCVFTALAIYTALSRNEKPKHLTAEFPTCGTFTRSYEIN
jgi:hypothetical protein